MPILGPELPPYLASRKRSPDNTCSPESRSQKRRVDSPRPTKNDPSIPIPLNVQMTPESYIGCKNNVLNSPKIASSSLEAYSTLNSEEAGIRLSTKESDGPFNVKILLGSNDSKKSLEATRNLSQPTNQPKRRVFGPELPCTSAHAELPSYNHRNQDSSLISDESSSSDDDYGPSLPSAHSSDSAEARNLAEDASEYKSCCSGSATKIKRADWMLTPPNNSDWNSRIDPTKLKNRKFATNRGAKGAADKSSVSAIWTESFEQKRQRLADEVLGRKELSVSSSSQPLLSNIVRDLHKNSQDTETERRIKEFNQCTRNKSLYEERQAAQGRGELEIKEADDPSKRAFDREKDMALARQIGAAQTKKLLGRATGFESRFQKGSYL